MLCYASDAPRSDCWAALCFVIVGYDLLLCVNWYFMLSCAVPCFVILGCDLLLRNVPSFPLRCGAVLCSETYDSFGRPADRGNLGPSSNLILDNFRHVLLCTRLWSGIMCYALLLFAIPCCAIIHSLMRICDVLYSDTLCYFMIGSAVLSFPVRCGAAPCMAWLWSAIMFYHLIYYAEIWFALPY